MNTCFSNVIRTKHINNNHKICPFNCCSCYIIKCCCYCHCNCHLNPLKAKSLQKALSYSLINTKNINEENINMPFNSKEIEQNNLYSKSNDNFNKRINKNILSDNKKLINLNNNLYNELNNLKTEIDWLKEKLKKEKQNISKVIKFDSNEINKRINMKNKDMDNIKNLDYNKINFNKENKKILKRIYVPKNMVNIKSINSHNNNLKLDLRNNYNENNFNKYKEKNIKYKNHLFTSKSPALNKNEKLKKVQLYYYPTNNTEPSDSGFQQRYFPFNSRRKIRLHEHIYKEQKFDDEINHIHQLDTFYHPQNKLNLEYNSFLTDISTTATQKSLNKHYDNLNNINLINKLSKSKIPICFNERNPKLILYRDKRHYLANSYENNKRKYQRGISPIIHKPKVDFLSNRKIDKLNDFKIKKSNLLNKYNINKIPQIKFLKIKKNPIFNKEYHNNERLNTFQDDNILMKSNSNKDFNKRNNEIKSLKINKEKNVMLSKKLYTYSKINSIKQINSMNNKINKKQLINNNNIDDKSNKLSSKEYKGRNFNKFRISPTEDDNINSIIDKYLKDKNIYNNKDINLSNKVGNNSDKNFLKKNNYLSFNKNQKNISIYNNYDLLKIKKEKIKSYNLNSEKKDNIVTKNNITKFNKEINNDIIESKNKIIINNKQFMTSKTKNTNLLSKMNVDTNLSLDYEIKNNPKIKFNKSKTDISPKTIFTLYTVSNKLYILCFDFINKKFSLRNFADFGNFEENYKLSFNYKHNTEYNSPGNLFLSKGPYLFIITGKNFDMLYEYDSVKQSMNKLCDLKNNHSNGALIDFSNNSLLCISGDYNKKVELFSISKNEWKNYLSETLIERSNFEFCIIKQRYIFLMFGRNNPTNEYLNTIEYYDLNSLNSNEWKYLNYNNKNTLLRMNICNGYGINFNNKKIIICGGYNGFEKEEEKNFIQLILSNDNNFDNIIIEKTERKLKDIDKNKKYYFNGGWNFFVENENNKEKILYCGLFDNDFNFHSIQISNLMHDIYYYDEKFKIN